MNGPLLLLDTMEMDWHHLRPDIRHPWFSNFNPRIQGQSPFIPFNQKPWGAGSKPAEDPAPHP
jgi:hypothetical protein